MCWLNIDIELKRSFSKQNSKGFISQIGSGLDMRFLFSLGCNLRSDQNSM